MSEDHDPVKVHVVKDDTSKPTRARNTRVTTLRTIILTAANPFDLILPHKPGRVCAYIQAGGANVILCDSSSDAQKNTTDPTYASPHGAVLPFGNTGPTPVSGANEVWGAAAVYPAQVSIIDISEAD